MSPSTAQAGRLVHDFSAMATRVRIEVHDPGPAAAEAIAAAEAVFHRVEAACTRFDRTSPLMRANAAGGDWYPVPAECFEAVREAALAHRATHGLFDPRVLRALTGLGYDRTLPFRDGGVRVELHRATAGSGDPGRPSLAGLAGPAGPAALDGVWSPGLDEHRTAVRIGPDPIDLGGIGKGLAVRWAAAEIACTTDTFASDTASFQVEAGGDCLLGGPGPDGGWRIAVEDPHGGAGPVAVLAGGNLACATSSVRLRTWTVGQEVGRDDPASGAPARRVHHLIDPRTGSSATPDPVSVTVVHADPADAEVWSKSLLIAGADRIADLAADRSLAALWVRADGCLGSSPAMQPYLIWPVRA